MHTSVKKGFTIYSLFMRDVAKTFTFNKSLRLLEVP
ncbi:hypothetical protein CLV93_102313 [Prolixibacter denitrificans]|uniref:Uncharacterized protein n=1 Tax=Prolixibacter denitrificans TaxID=1541063 RepID=A0A2P8CHR7_9BACT|nr:hypothetical protein CLV93_102313 [Prolixibacter denitrificans]